jgi:hypothetical protein
LRGLIYWRCRTDHVFFIHRVICQHNLRGLGVPHERRARIIPRYNRSLSPLFTPTTRVSSPMRLESIGYLQDESNTLKLPYPGSGTARTFSFQQSCCCSPEQHMRSPEVYQINGTI